MSTFTEDQRAEFAAGLDQIIAEAPDYTPSGAEHLAECEEVIRRGLATFVEVGTALATIRDERLYLIHHDTFEDYCREVWGFSRSRAHRMIEAAEVMDVLPMGNIPITSERQAREVAAIIKSNGPERAAEVLAEVAADGPVTANAIREAARPVEVVEVVTVDAGTGEIIDARDRLDDACDLLDAAMDAAEAAPTVEEYVSADADYRAAVLRKELGQWINRFRPPAALPPAEAADLIGSDELKVALLRSARASFDAWCDEFEQSLKPSARLRVVKGM